MASRLNLQTFLEEILESADGQKLVIIARFLPEIHAIEQMLTRKGIRYAIIHGGVSDRAAQVTAFQTDPTVQVFIGQIATAGLGIQLTAASTMVFYSLDYSMCNYEQTKARIHRGGQVIWEKAFLSGEDNMSHTIANLEYHHFKYDLFRQPGDLHVHMFGTATLSFADGIRTEDGDVFEVEAAAFGLPLKNPLARAAAGNPDVTML